MADGTQTEEANSEGPVEIKPVTHAGLIDLIPLMRAYCDFYEVEPREARLLSLSRALLEDPHDGVQLIARDESGAPVGFTTIYWTWSTLDADRIGVMYDLFVDPEARRRGIARALIEAARARCRERGVPKLTWTTAPDNEHARALYGSIGAEGENWIEYELSAW